MKQLLQNESDMEKLVFSLKKLLDGLKGVSFDEDIPELHKDLYISLEKKMYESIRWDETNQRDISASQESSG